MKFSKPLKHVWYVTTYHGESIWYGKHKGLDLRTKNKHFPTGVGQPLYAPADGKVTMHRWDERAGNMLFMDHGDGWTTRYYHLADYVGHQGREVKEGELIGHCGDTGKYVRGSHLHWEVRKDNVPVDPLKYLKTEGEQEDILKEIDMTYEELLSKLSQDGFVKKRVELNQDPKNGAVYWVNNNKKYKLGTQPDDIAVIGALLAGEPLSDVERSYPTTTNRKDVF